ncbi:MAG: DUF4418 family protein [Oscillospiraceae bacterium]|jgi:hypothetical protein|nr:DUF4418 family protein [Oscillospiraceae bacterium]
MKNRLIISILFLLLGTAIAWGPQTIFPICGIRGSTNSAMTNKADNTTNTAMMGDKAMNNSEHSMNNSQHSMTKKHMKCWYTGRWEIGVGSLISVLGLLLILLKKRERRIALSIAAFLSGIFALLIPTVIVGVCGNKNMDCNAIALPALIIFSSVVIIAAAVNTVFLFKTKSERLK